MNQFVLVCIARSKLGEEPKMEICFHEFKTEDIAIQIGQWVKNRCELLGVDLEWKVFPI